MTAIENRPGLPQIAYRSGTHATILERLLAGLSTADRPHLRRLTTRETDDFTIGLLDAVATAADVLTFYQERIANESYLRTATERRSVLELARAIGYELSPGVAAETALAFTLETAAGAPAVVPIDAGTRVQSIPGPGQRPQTFETVEAIEARGAWNVLRPRATEPVTPHAGQSEAWLAGVETALLPGDALLIAGDERAGDPGSEAWDVGFLRTVEPDHERGATRVTWHPPLQGTPAQQHARPFALRARLSLFGAAAPDWRLLTSEVRGRYDPDGSAASDPEWPGLTVSGIAGEAGVVHVDGAHPEVLTGSWVVLLRPGARELYEVTSAQESARNGFGLAGKTTRLALEGERLGDFETHVRETVVYARADELAFAERPVAAPVGGAEIELDGAVEHLPAGRSVVVTGVPDGDLDGAPVAEVRAVEAMETPAGGRTTLTLAEPLTHTLRRATVTIAANVAQATHGESVAEPLGSGDAAQPLQRFALRRSPLTHVYADTPSGRRAALDVRVDGVRWDEVPALFGHGPAERVYVLRIDDDAKATVQFGDGRTGARLPTAPENVSAAYRVGLGADGNVEAGTVTLPLVRPLGLTSVTNPVAATGGTDPEVLADARTNAPLTVLTLDRIVSLADHADFARAFEGIAKAHATWVWGPAGRTVLLTVAGAAGAAVVEGGPTFSSLLQAMARVRDAHVPLVLRSFDPIAFRLAATITRDEALTAEDVLAGAEGALRERFSFTARGFGQPVALSEVLAVLHGVRGVVAVDVDSLYTGTTPVLQTRLDALVPVEGQDLAEAQPAQLLTIDLRARDVEVA